MDSELQHIADKVRSGRRIDAAEALALWRGAPLWLLGVVLCFAFFTVLPLLESVVPLTEFRELVDQSALAQVFENGNLIISIMNRRL